MIDGQRGSSLFSRWTSLFSRFSEKHDKRSFNDFACSFLNPRKTNVNIFFNDSDGQRVKLTVCEGMIKMKIHKQTTLAQENVMEKLTLNLSRVKHFLLQSMPIRRRWLQFHVLTGSLFLYAFLMPERMNKEVDGGPLCSPPSQRT